MKNMRFLDHYNIRLFCGLNRRCLKCIKDQILTYYLYHSMYIVTYTKLFQSMSTKSV